MHHPTNRITHTTNLLHQSWSIGWNEKYVNGSTMTDRSDDPSQNERFCQEYIYHVSWYVFLRKINSCNRNKKNKVCGVQYSLHIFSFNENNIFYTYLFYEYIFIIKNIREITPLRIKRGISLKKKKRFKSGMYVLIHIENTTWVPVGDDLSYNEWFLKRI